MLKKRKFLLEFNSLLTIFILIGFLAIAIIFIPPSGDAEENPGNKIAIQSQPAYMRPNDFLPITKANCTINPSTAEVAGHSMEPLIPSSSVITYLNGYYSCNQVLKEDIVIYSFAGNKNPLIKIVKAVEGDDFRLDKNEHGCINLIVDGKTAMNSAGHEYCLSEKTARMLALYEKDYQGKMPPDSVLLMGDNALGTIDSTYFGLVNRHDLAGKVVLE